MRNIWEWLKEPPVHTNGEVPLLFNIAVSVVFAIFPASSGEPRWTVTILFALPFVLHTIFTLGFDSGENLD